MALDDTLARSFGVTVWSCDVLPQELRDLQIRLDGREGARCQGRQALVNVAELAVGHTELFSHGEYLGNVKVRVYGGSE